MSDSPTPRHEHNQSETRPSAFASGSGSLNGISRSNGEQLATSEPSLKILIVGAGIAGLTAAIGLRREGHEVHIFEQSQLAEEIGAAIHIFPNANSILRRLDVRHEEKGAVKLLQTRYFDSRCNLLSVNHNDAESHRWQANWLQAHRGQLHAHLKQTAISSEGDGPPVLIHTSSRIVSVDPHQAQVRFERGDVVKGDVLIGADGVRSVCRVAVAGPGFDCFPYGKSAFRFMVPRAKVVEDPETREIGEILGSLDMFFSPENKVIIYPCVNDTLLNVVCIHPSRLSEASAESYNTSVSREKVLEVFHEFDRRILKIFEKCDSDTLKVWPILDAADLSTFVNDHLALIGDAAHPFTPFIGQGGAQAIEDAAALTVMLSKGVTAADVPERLQLYNQARVKRATLIQGFSRVAGADSVKPGEEKAAKMRGREHALYALSHDETHASQQLLRQSKWRKATGARWSQPIAFGSIPRGTQTDTRTTTVRIKFKTSGTLLRNLFPDPSYSFVNNDTVALASFSILSRQNVELLGGHGFRQVLFEVHGVRYQKSDGSFVQGRYLPIVYEDSADMISLHREQFGYPSVFSEIHETSESTDYVHINLSWMGTMWASFWLKDLKEESLPNTPSKTGVVVEEGAFVHKYVPTTTDKPAMGHVDAEYDVFLADTLPSSKIDNSHSHTNGNSISAVNERLYRTSSNAGFEIMAPQKDKLLTLHHVVDRLRELPVFEIVEATVKDHESPISPASAIRMT